MRPVFFKSPAHFRAWLDASHQKCVELWVGFYKKSSGKPSITYPEALDEALCFGWIDGVRRSVDSDAYTIRFTPRKPRSQWSAVNIRRAQKLDDAGRMRPAGRKAFAGARDQPRKYSYEQRRQASFQPEQERQFRANRKAWDYFQSQPPWYRRTATFWVVSAQKAETRQKRLATLIEDSGHGRPIKPLTRPVPKRHKKRR
ncbi:MAG: YdeI/OmpD-associated family protein [Terriglobales bacterium]